MLRVLVTGDRFWSDRELLEDVLDRVLAIAGTVVVIEGECEGADSMARAWAEDHKMDVDPYPASWRPGRHTPPERIRRRRDGTEYDVAGGALRNQEMLVKGRPHLALAFHPDLRESKGTLDMVRRAESAHLPVFVFPHDTRKDQMVLGSPTLEECVRDLTREAA